MMLADIPSPEAERFASDLAQAEYDAAAAEMFLRQMRDPIFRALHAIRLAGGSPRLVVVPGLPALEAAATTDGRVIVTKRLADQLARRGLVHEGRITRAGRSLLRTIHP